MSKSKVQFTSAAAILGAALVLSALAQSPPSTMTVSGTISFQGTLPARPSPRVTDPYCAQFQPTSDGLEDVVVHAKPVTQSAFPAPQGTVLLDRKECRYIPHTLTVQVGQQVIIRNSDATAHNAHGWPRVNTPFNHSLLGGAEFVRIFDKEEDLFPIRDDVHNWEFANVRVFSHPYHTVSKLNGEYTLKLSPGPYEIVVWHEKLGTQTRQFEARTGETRGLDFVFK